jgi:hypothetical protein
MLWMGNQIKRRSEMRSSIVYSAMILGGVAATLAAAPVSGAVWYTYDYDGSVLPTDDTPAWTRSGSATVTEAKAYNPGDTGYSSTGLADPGYFQLASTSSSWIYNLAVSSTAWGGNDNTVDAFTFEFRAKIVAKADKANVLSVTIPISDTVKGVAMLLNDTGGTFANSTFSAPTGSTFDPTVYNTYRITAQKNGAAFDFALYLNDNPAAVATKTGGGNSITTSNVSWGDSGSGTNGTFDLDYIRWNNTQALVPTQAPEPGTFAGMMVLGGWALCRRRRGA